MTETDRAHRAAPTRGFSPPPPRRVGMAMLGVGALGIVAAVLGTLVGLGLVSRIDATFGNTLTLTSATLETVEESLTVAGNTMALVDEGLTEADGTLRSLVATVDEGEESLAAIAELTGTDVADSLTAVEDSMPALIQVAEAVDTSLSTLSSLPFGPPYNPERPFDDSMRSLQASLDGLPEQLREQSELIASASDNLDEVGRGADGVADSVQALDEGLTDARELLEGYSATATEARSLIDETEAELGRQARLARIMVVVMGVAVALSQVVPLYFGWLLFEGTQPPFAPRQAGGDPRP